MPPTTPLHINLFLAGTGHHEASWRHPAADAAYAASAEHYVELAVAAEGACLDSIFIADGLSTAIDIRHGMPRNFEPITLLSAIAARTQNIGLIGTMSTTFTEPFNLARQFASLDHLSNGRAGWNMVTTAEERSAHNFGSTSLPNHEQRYGRANEFVHAVKALWDSWSDDAIVADTTSGIYAKTSKVRAINHDGEYFQIRGPLNISRPPQGHPVLVQAGASQIGQRFAAAHAELTFAVHNSLDDAAASYRSFKAQVAACGRNPQLVKVLPGIVPIIGDSEAAARRRAQELDDLIIPSHAIARLEERLGISLRGHSLDDRLPPLPAAHHFRGQQGRYQVIKDLVEREGLTLREILRRLGGGRGHNTIIGDPEQIAARMAEWHTAGAADGFTVLPPLLPECVDLFVQHVVPALRRRGLLRSSYAGATLRDHYGLPRLVVSGLSGPAGAGNRRFEWPHLRLSGQVLSGLGGPT